MFCVFSLRCCLKDAALNAASPILRLTRAGETAWGGLPGDDWTIFSPNHSTYEPLAWATRNSVEFMSEEISRTPLPTVLQVCGFFLKHFLAILHVCCISQKHMFPGHSLFITIGEIDQVACR
jgi:heparan sulfate-N-deacetylase.